MTSSPISLDRSITALTLSPECRTHNQQYQQQLITHNSVNSDLVWRQWAKDLGDLYHSLQASLTSMEKDFFALLHSLVCENQQQAVKLFDKLQNAGLYIREYELEKLNEFQSAGMLRLTQMANSHDCPAFVKISVRRWSARVQQIIEEITLIQLDVQHLGKSINCSGDQLIMSAQDVQSRISALYEHFRNPDDHNPPRIEGKIVQVSHSFLSDLLRTTELLEEENKQLRANQMKLKRIARCAKDQRGQLKELAAKFKQEREDAFTELGRVSQLLEKLQEDDNADCESQNLQSQLPNSEQVHTELDEKVLEILGDRRGKLLIFVRVRPDESNNFLLVESRNKILLQISHQRSLAPNCMQHQLRTYYFDRVFHAACSNGDIFKEMIELVNNCCSGINVCIMAYGQTGSGKTFTMTGDKSNPGLNRLAITSVMQLCRQSRDFFQHTFCLSAVEIYNEEIRDLLRLKAPVKAGNSIGLNDNSSQQNSKLKLVTDINGDTVISGLTEMPIANENEIDKYLEILDNARVYSATDINQSSSRSHVIMVLTIRQYDSIGNCTQSSLTLCDLAGSESVTKSGVRGRSLREASSINRSLLSLGKVFEDLRKRQRPCFRESKLTRLLKPHLTGHSKCLVIVTVRQSQQFLDETLRSLSFGQNAMQTETRDLRAQAKVQ